MQTQIQLIKKHGLSIRGHLGQHLLVDPNIARKIVGLLDLQPGDEVVEIGPGLGALTVLLAQHQVHLLCVEKDMRFVKVLKEEVAPAELRSFNLVQEDVLRFDLSSYYQKKITGKKTFKAISNLPYYITGPIIFKLIAMRPLISQAVLMMQKEVAARLTAQPGTKDYGKLTLAVQYGAETRFEFNVSPGCFTPQPEVESTVVTMKFRASALLEADAEKIFFELIETAFSQRRKTLIPLLRKKWKALSKLELEQVFSAMQLGHDVRGERLSLAHYLDLARWMKNHLASA